MSESGLKEKSKGKGAKGRVSKAKDIIVVRFKLGPPTPEEVASAKVKTEGVAKFKADKKDAKDLPKYQVKLDEARAAKETLSKMPSAVAQLKLVSDALDKAAATIVATDGGYSAALAVLDAAKISKCLEDGEKAQNNALKGSRKNFPEQYAAADKLEAEAAHEILPKQAQSEFGEMARTALAPLLDVNALTSLGEEASKALADAAAKLKERIEECTAARAQADANRQTIKTLLDKARPTMPTDIGAEFDQYLLQANTQYGEREYETAALSTAALIAWSKAAVDSEEAARDSLLEPLGKPWKKGFDAVLQQARDLVAQAETVPPLAQAEPRAAATVGALRNLLENGLGGSGKVPPKLSAAEALKLFERCKAEIALNQTRVIGYQKLQDVRSKADAEMQEQIGYTTAALKHLARAAEPFLPEGMSAAKIAAPFEARFATLQRQWKTRMATAVSARELDGPGMLASIRALRAEIREIYGADAPQSRKGVIAGVSVQGLTEKAQRRELQTVRDGCAAKLDTLTALSVEFGQKGAKRLAAASSEVAAAKTPGDVAKCLADMQTLAEQLDKWTESAADIGKKTRGTIDPLLKETTAQFDALSAAITKGKKEDDYGALRDRFNGELAEQKLLAKTSDQVLLEGVVASLTELRDNIAKATDALNGKDTTGGAVMTTKQIRNQIDTRRKWLSSEMLTKYLATEKTALGGKLDDIAEEVDGRLPEESWTSLTEWDAMLAKAEKDAAKAKAAYDAFASMAEGLWSRLAEPDFDKAKGFRDALTAKLKACLDTARQDGEYQAGKTALFAIDKEIGLALTDPEAMKKGQQDVVAAERAAAVDREQWKSRMAVFQKQAEEATAWRSKPRKEVEDLAKTADKAFKTGGDIKAAMKLLANAQRRLNYYKKYPDGQDTAKRQTLPKVVAAWRKDLADLKKEIDKVAEGVEKMSDLGETEKKDVKAQINLLSGMLNPGAFDNTAKEMTKKGRDPQDMRGIREVGLREAARSLDIIENDVRFQALALNPFSTGTGLAIVAARLALLKVEHTLKTSL